MRFRNRAGNSTSGRRSPQQAITAPLSSEFRWNNFPVRYPEDAAQWMCLRGVEKFMALYLLPVLPIDDIVRLQYRVVRSREN